uniref:Myb-like domain-containing protein n=1 Tax=Rhizophora mucronata TaxID=61149 RepID=A0A2P2JDW9_RHIMU
MHKRASMPKCALEQLKGAIVGGSHPCAALLKEPGGLVQTIDGRDNIFVDNGGDNGKTWGIHGNDPDTQDMAPEDTSASLLLENENGAMEDDLHSRSLLPSKRDRTNLDKEIVLGGHRESLPPTGDADDHLHVKRLKQGATFVDQSMGQVPIHGNDLLGGSSEKAVKVIENDGGDMEKESQGTGFEETAPLKNGCDEHVTVRLPQSHDADVDEGFERNQKATVNSSEIAQDTSGDVPGHCIMVNKDDDAAYMTSKSTLIFRSQLKGSVDETEDVDDHGIQLSSPNDLALNNSCRKTGFGVEGGMAHIFEEDTSSDSDEHHHERADVARKKSRFLNPQCMLSYDFVETADWTEQSLCVKCSKAGQLLVCSASGCPLAVHANCLSSPVKFDDEGNFYCPFSAYSQAISDYLESKKKVSLAKKELIAFVRSSSDHPLKRQTETLQPIEHGNSKQKGDENHLHKSHKLVDGGIEREASEQQTTDSPKDTLFISNLYGDVMSDDNQLRTKEHDGSGQNRDENDSHQTHDKADGKFEREASEHQIVDSSKKPICSINDGNDMSDNEDEKSIISNYSMRLRRGDRQYTYPAIPLLRRKKVPWTAKEEEMLKEGVQKFSTDNSKIIPWKKILEYGNFVFMKGHRTTVDLKDKWRNMCRGSPISK